MACPHFPDMGDTRTCDDSRCHKRGYFDYGMAMFVITGHHYQTEGKEDVRD